MTTPSSPTVSATPGVVVNSGTTVTLIGEPAGGAWAQISGQPVTLTPVAVTGSTRVSFVAENTDTNVGISRSFKYTINAASTAITVSASPLTLNVRGSFTNVDTLSAVTLNGAVTGTSVTYAWTKLSGPQGTLSSSSIATPTYTPQVPGRHVLGLITTSAGVSAPLAVFEISALSGHGIIVRRRGARITARRFTRRLGLNDQNVTAGAPLSAPTSVQVVRSATSATLSWMPPAETGGAAITGYRVSRDGQDSTGYGIWTAIVPSADRSFVFNDLVELTPYTLTVQAVTYAGSGPSGSVSA